MSFFRRVIHWAVGTSKSDESQDDNDSKNDSASESDLENSTTESETNTPINLNAITVTEEHFCNAKAKIATQRTDFLVALPPAKLRYRLTQGEHAGNSYLWLLAEDAFRGNPRPLESVSKHITPDDLRTKPNNDERTLLWLVASAACKGNVRPLMIILKTCGTKLNTEDLELETQHHKVRDLLMEVAAKYPKVGYYIPGLLKEKESHCGDDDSCGSAGTHKNEYDDMSGDNSADKTDTSCRSAGTFKGDDDDDNILSVATSGKSNPPVVSRTHSQGSILHVSNPDPELRKWKNLQNEISKARSAKSPESDDDLDIATTPSEKSKQNPPLLRMYSQSSSLQFTDKHSKAQRKRENAQKAKERNAQPSLALTSPRPAAPAPVPPAAPAVSTSAIDATSPRKKR